MLKGINNNGLDLIHCSLLMIPNGLLTSYYYLMYWTGLTPLPPALLLPVCWAPWAVHTGDNYQHKKSDQNSCQNPYQQAEPSLLLLYNLFYLSTAVLVGGWATAEHSHTLLTVGAVETSVPPAMAVNITRAVGGAKDYWKNIVEDHTLHNHCDHNKSKCLSVQLETSLILD